MLPSLAPLLEGEDLNDPISPSSSDYLVNVSFLGFVLGSVMQVNK